MEHNRHLSDFLSPGSPATDIIPAISADNIVTTLLQIHDTPPVFGEANIGRAAINIAANRLLAAGAMPRYVAASLFLDTDTPVGDINVVADGLQSAAIQAEMEWTARAVSFSDNGPNYGLNMSVYAIGQAIPGLAGSKPCMQTGDTIIVTSPVGTFGTAVESFKQGITTIENADGTALIDSIRNLIDCVQRIHYLDLAENGFEDAYRKLTDMAPAAIDRTIIPVNPAVNAECQLLERDPLRMPCADAMLLVVPDHDAPDALAALRRCSPTSLATVIGHIL